MSQEDIYEVERMEKEALDRYEAQMQEPTWRDLTEGYVQRNSNAIKALESRLTDLEDRVTENGG